MPCALSECSGGADRRKRGPTGVNRLGGDAFLQVATGQCERTSVKRLSPIVSVVFLVGATASGVVPADHRHGARVGVGVVIGAPLLWGYYPRYLAIPGYYPYSPVYSYPPAVVVQPSAPVYIERAPRSIAGDDGDYWYYCRKPRGYYPYVKKCPGGWERVAPRPEEP